MTPRNLVERFIQRDILIEVDGGLRRAVEEVLSTLEIENERLRLELQALQQHEKYDISSFADKLSVELCKIKNLSSEDHIRKIAESALSRLLA